MSSLFRNYQNQSLKLAMEEGLLIESNVHEILSLSSILLISPNSHSPLMIDLFGSALLEQIHEEFVPTQKIELDPELESKFREAIKKANKVSRDHGIDWLSAEILNNRNLKNFGSVILKGLETLPIDKIEISETSLITNHLDYIMKGIFHNPDKHIVQWPNTALNKSKSRTNKPDFVVSVIHQLQMVADISIGEVSPPSQKTNVYKNCNDLIQLSIFLKDCMDCAIDNGAEINVIGFQCIGKEINMKCFFHL